MDRRKLAAKRREKVLRGGKSRLDYITGKVDEPPPKSRVANVGPSTSDGETKRPDALETTISNTEQTKERRRKHSLLKITREVKATEKVRKS